MNPAEYQYRRALFQEQERRRYSEALSAASSVVQEEFADWGPPSTMEYVVWRPEGFSCPDLVHPVVALKDLDCGVRVSDGRRSIEFARGVVRHRDLTAGGVGVPAGTTLTFRAWGPDAEEGLVVIRQAIDRGRPNHRAVIKEYHALTKSGGSEDRLKRSTKLAEQTDGTSEASEAAAQAWPGADEEPWWWKNASSFMRGLYLKACAAKEESGRRLKDEPWPEATPEPDWWREAPSWARRLYGRIARGEPERRQTSPLYIRFGDAPAGGISSTGWHMKTKPKYEKGVSVFRGYRDEDGTYIVDTSRSLAQLFMYKKVAKEGRSVYLAEGREVDFGSDGEPVLQDVELTPLPEGSRVRCSGHWQHAAPWMCGLMIIGSFGKLAIPSFHWEGPQEMTTGLDRVSPSQPVSDPATALEEVLAHSTSRDSRLHGEDHWQSVAIVGAELAERTQGADPLIVFLFAVLHDSARIFDGYDNWHGFRAAKMAQNLLGDGALVSEEQLRVLCYALEEHDAGEISTDPSVSVCWDADRLNLWRVGIEPDPALLSTTAARDPEMIERARILQREPFGDWPEILARFDLPCEYRGEGER